MMQSFNRQQARRFCAQAYEDGVVVLAEPLDAVDFGVGVDLHTEHANLINLLLQ